MVEQRYRVLVDQVDTLQQACIASYLCFLCWVHTHNLSNASYFFSYFKCRNATKTNTTQPYVSDIEHDPQDVEIPIYLVHSKNMRMDTLYEL